MQDLWWLSGKEPACNAGATGDLGSIPGSGRYSGGKNGNPLQYFCWKKPMDRGAWWAMVHRVAKSQTRLSTRFDILIYWRRFAIIIALNELPLRFKMFLLTIYISSIIFRSYPLPIFIAMFTFFFLLIFKICITFGILL